MKQLTENPSERSVVLGWKVMLRLCQQARSWLGDHRGVQSLRTIGVISVIGLIFTQLNHHVYKTAMFKVYFVFFAGFD